MKIAIIGTCRQRGLRHERPSSDKHLIPWHIEDELRALGANYVQVGRWRCFAIRDGNLLAGQQPLHAEIIFTGETTP